MKDKKDKEHEEEMAEDWDFTDGFGGLPEDVELTRNIGCVGGRKTGDGRPKTGDRRRERGVKDKPT